MSITTIVLPEGMTEHEVSRILREARRDEREWDEQGRPIREHLFRPLEHGWLYCERCGCVLRLNSVVQDE